jgi:hypothetical protein
MDVVTRSFDFLNRIFGSFFPVCEQFYELLERILRVIGFSSKATLVWSVVVNLLPFFFLFLFLLPGKVTLRFVHSLASRSLFSPLFRIRSFIFRISHLLLVLSIIHSVSLYAIYVQPQLQSVQRDLSIFGKRELVNIARNFIETAIAIFGTFITIITWKLWGLGNVIFYENESLKLKETILSSTHSIQQQPPRPQPQLHPQTLSQQQLKQPLQSQQSVLHEDRQNGDLKKRNVSTTLPTASITKRSLPLVPVNPYGFLSPSQSPSQSISSDDHVD